MAISPKHAALGPVLELPVKDVAIHERVGLFWIDKAMQIGASIAADGQNDPIKVRKAGPRSDKPWALVAGLHRLRGCELAMLPTVVALEVEGSDDDLRLIEASENLHRRDFEPLERAMFVRALADIYERRFTDGHDGLSAQQIGQINRWQMLRDNVRLRDEQKVDAEAEMLGEEYSPAIVAGLGGWQAKTAEEAGISERTLRDCLLIHRAIIEPAPRDLIKQFATHAEGRSRKALMKLTSVGRDEQRRAIIEWLIAHPDASLDNALHACGLAKADSAPAPNGQTKLMNNAGANLDRLSASSWREWAPTLAAKIKPSALVAVRDAIEARLAAMDDGADMEAHDA